MECISEKILEVIEVIEESVILNCPEDTEELNQINKIRDYISQQEI